MKVLENLEDIQYTLYEVRNCVRESSLEDIVTELQEAFENSLTELNYIDTQVDYETVYED